MFHRLLLSSATAIIGLVLCGACFAYADEPQDGPVEAPPMTRTRAGAGYLLYSIGSNLKDEGGEERASGGDDLVLKIER